MMNDHEDLIAFLRAQIDLDERTALLALKGHNIGDPADMPPELRAARWWSDYERLSVIVGSKNTPMCTISGANWHAAHHIYLHQPQRVLREVEAKRAIIKLYTREPDSHGGYVDGWYSAADAALRLLALAYADRPGYREEWKP